MVWWILIAVVAAAIVSIPFVQELRRDALDPSNAKGRFADLPSGRTHYRWFGGARGPVAVCVHGLTTPSDVWEPFARELCDLGYRVLIYDLYGRGFSDNVAGPQTAEFFVTQLRELLDDQGLEDDLTLVGYSMGGSIVTAFTARYSHRVQRVVLIASAGVEYDEEPFLRRILGLSFLGTWLHAAIEPFRMRRALAAEAGTGDPALHQLRLAQIERPGYFPAVIASRRGILSDRQEKEHRAISRLDIPVFALWGEEDDVIPIQSVGTLARWNRAALQDTIPGANHGLVVTHSRELAALYRTLVRGD
ncbi:alpha/beta hydrolase [Ponticoccus sp. SC2-23]|uniref:alpha/beta fold hydrolase n=1 Tax=Alexandriicola marinus TaxID=2081710 RepID=UPI000FD92B6D|nr:alpha/beta hydrolase [Alexandriicola marinus]MBM1221884.1 alpha/beta hydrolase [Ponticoccus sp. SC6-9]MBM1226235.1 alpha/beta hydrolase [Ponticoccus sp. SC6-15]MBM1230831.1 alpha/beta hydrolase [Ponticoccus sp. SC6-38]MBM1235328.1 alpha/beta hydrolase [Ponticoccus sp. SC6-45]MBM1239853.1 alpha/beta hydrolase [Ponticoccus sp. SC6-49]MBM1243997.1 alpha/beta hydrolase [Ponticoccus sp. SC2-64]MBM1248852.1 alpha/beta hydrolase [Ponticoccus sp. SC6-42]MBM1253508.1 alpha/beta hydrolase [Pontico